jgi:glycosyltransferase involved in cell wall biosynthesis
MATSHSSDAGAQHIALFLPCLAGGGAQRVMVTFANELSTLGLRVDLVVGSAAGPFRAEISSAVSLLELGSPRAGRCLLPLVRYLRQERPDWLLSTLLRANIIAVAAQRLSGSRTRVWLREATTPSRAFLAEPWWLGLGSRWALKFAYRQADGIVAPSQGVADDLCALTGAELRQKLHVLMNPIPTREISQLATAPLPQALSEIPKPWIVGCGRLYGAKGFDVLIRAVAELQTLSELRPSLIILGEGQDRASLVRLAAELGLAERTHFPGFVDNPFRVLGRAAVFVLSSHFEGCPNVLLQAMACGVPVVSTDCPSGPREILQHEAQGLLAPVGDAVGLARAIARQLEQPGDMRAVRARAEDFAAPVVARQLLALLQAPAGRATLDG